TENSAHFSIAGQTIAVTFPVDVHTHKYLFHVENGFAQWQRDGIVKASAGFAAGTVFVDCKDLDSGSDIDLVHVSTPLQKQLLELGEGAAIRRRAALIARAGPESPPRGPAPIPTATALDSSRSPLPCGRDRRESSGRRAGPSRGGDCRRVPGIECS